MELITGTVSPVATRTTTKGACITLEPSQKTAEMLDMLYRAGVLGAKSKRAFARDALDKAVKERFDWAKEKGIL